MKYVKPLFVTLLLFCLFLTGLAFAEEYPCNGTIIKNAVNVRKDANTKSDKVASLQNGDTVTVIGEETAGNTVWYQIEMKNGKNGYVRGDLIEVGTSAAISNALYDVPSTDNPPIETDTDATDAPPIADDTDDSEVRFRKIPWGTDAQTVVSLLYLLEGFPSSSTYHADMQLESWNYDLLDKKDADHISISEAGSWLRYSSPKDQNDNRITLAGYPIKYLFCYFMYGYDGNDVVLREKSDTRLYKVEYQLDVTDVVEAQKELSNKLSAMYGSPKNGSSSNKVLNLSGNDYTKYYEWSQWNGANSTAVYTFVEYRIYNNTNEKVEYKLSVYYAKTDSTKELINIGNVIEQEKIRLERADAEKNKNNYTGL